MRILITNNHIENFAGSEINALQLCLAMKGMGHEVDAATFFFNNPIKQFYDKNQINVINLFDHNKEIGYYDFYWVHHAPTLNYLVFTKEIDDALVLFSSLGPFEPLEAPPYYHDELNLILTNSGGNKEMMLNHGVREEKIKIFPNYAPRHFFSHCASEWPDMPQKIAVISNHPPDELRDLSKLLQKGNKDVHFFGIEDIQIFVDDALIKKYDLVITIGKTVQYCFSLKVPVYCYDFFGGPGFINTNNMDISKHYNFSGRGINRKLSGEDLLQDIENNYQHALDDLSFLYQYALRHFCLEKNLINIMESVSKLEKTRCDYLRKKYSLVGRYHQLYLRNQSQILDANYNYSRTQSQLADTQSQLADTQSRLADTQSRLADIHKSKAWRVVKFMRKWVKILLPPGGFMRKLLRRIYKLLVQPFKKLRNRKKIENDIKLIRSSELFDEKWYLEKYPDVAKAKIDPAHHYLLHGGFEGRDPGPNFFSRKYLSENPDVFEANVNPLLYYIKFGKHEGRKNHNYS